MTFTNDNFDDFDRDMRILRDLGVDAKREDVEELAKAVTREKSDAELFVELAHERKFMLEAAMLEIERLKRLLAVVSTLAVTLAATLAIRIFAS